MRAAKREEKNVVFVNLPFLETFDPWAVEYLNCNAIFLFVFVMFHLYFIWFSFFGELYFPIEYFE